MQFVLKNICHSSNFHITLIPKLQPFLKQRLKNEFVWYFLKSVNVCSKQHVINVDLLPFLISD